MKRYLFIDRLHQAVDAGLTLERDMMDGHPYCLWFNSPSGSKEWWIRNLCDEFEYAFNEAVVMKQSKV